MTLENLLSVPFGKTTTDAGGRVYRGPGVPDYVDLRANIRWDISATVPEQQAEQEKKARRRKMYKGVGALLATGLVGGGLVVVGIPSIEHGHLQVPALPFNNGGTESNDVSWLFTTSSVGGKPHLIDHPPKGESPNGAAGVHIDTNPAHRYTVWGAPTISCAEFVNVLKANHSPAAPVAAEMWYKAYVDGINPAAILGIFGGNSNYGKYPNDRPLPSWRTSLESIADEQFRQDSTGHTPDDNSGVMDFSRFKNNEGWVVSTAYFDEWLGQYAKHDLVSIADKWSTDNDTYIDVGGVETIMASYDGK